MNSSLRRAITSLRINKSQFSSPFIRVQSEVPSRGIKRWVRPMILTFNKLREKEIKIPNPRSSFAEWNYNAELFALGKRLGETFNDPLLRQALIDESFAIDEKLKQAEVGIEQETAMSHNESMALEGNEILKKIIRETLKDEYPKFPSQGIDAVANYLTSDEVMAYISKHIGTSDLILVPINDYPPNEKILAKAFRAIVSALNTSSGSRRTKRFVQDIVVTHLCGKDINEIWDIPFPWRQLESILQDSPEPRILREAGKNTILSSFVIGLYNNEKKLIGTGIGETVEIAQEMAARDALAIHFNTKEPRPPFKFLRENEMIESERKHLSSS